MFVNSMFDYTRPVRPASKDWEAMSLLALTPLSPLAQLEAVQYTTIHWRDKKTPKKTVGVIEAATAALDGATGLQPEE